MTESQVQAAILLALGGDPQVRMFRNLVGSGFVGEPPNALRRVTFGLAVGSGDLIGFRSYTVTPEDVGRTVAVFSSCEVKRPRNSHTAKNQKLWRDMVQARGGIAVIAKSVESAVSEVMGWKPTR